MIMADKTWRDVFFEQVDAEHSSSREPKESIQDRYWDAMADRFEQAGFDIDDVLTEEVLDKPWRPLSSMIGDLQKDAERREKSEQAHRSQSNAEWLEQQKRIGKLTQAEWVEGLAPAAPAFMPPPETSFKPPSIRADVTMPAPESRAEMSQRLGMNIPRDEYEQRIADLQAEEYLDATLINEKPVEEYIEPDEKSADFERRVFLARDRVMAERRRAGDPTGMSSQYEKTAHKRQLRETQEDAMRQTIGDDFERPDYYAEEDLPSEPESETRKAHRDYITELMRHPAIKEEFERSTDHERWTLRGGLGGAVAAPAGTLTGAVSKAAQLVGEATSPLLLEGYEKWEEYVEPAVASQLAAISRQFGEGKLANEFEQKWFQRERELAKGEHWSQTAAFGEDTAFEEAAEVWRANDALIESRMKNKDFWRSARADFADNIAGLGHLVTVFMPSSIDILNAIKTTKPDGYTDRVMLSFKYGFDQGGTLTAAMAGAIMSILTSPKKAAAAQPISTAMTLFPLFKLLKAANVKGAGMMLDKLDDIAKKSGFDLENPYFMDESGAFKKLTIPEQLANRFINEARSGARTRWGNIVQNKFAQTVLSKDYIQGVKGAIESGTRLEKFIPEFKPGVSRTAKVGAAAYIASQQDLEDTAAALAVFGAPAATVAALAKSQRYGDKVSRLKSGMQRIAVDIGIMSDPFLTEKVQDMIDRLQAGRAMVESDILTIKQALGGTKEGKLALEKLIPDLSEIVAARAALKGRAEAVPEVQALKTVSDQAEVIYRDAKEAGVVGDELKALKDEFLGAQGAWRARRAEAVVEMADAPDFRLPETGALQALERLLTKSQDLKVRHNTKMAEIDKAETAALDELANARTPEKVAELREKLLDRALKEVGIKKRRLARNQTAHLQFLRDLESTVKNGTQQDYAKAIARYEDRISKAAKEFDARVARGDRGVETKMLDETRKAEISLLDELDDLGAMEVNELGLIDDAKTALIDNIRRERFAVAERVGRGVRGIDEGATAAGVEARLAEAIARQDNAVRKRFQNKRDGEVQLNDDMNKVVNRDIEVQETTIETHNTRAAESAYLGDVLNEGQHVFEVDAPVAWDIDNARMGYLDNDGNFTTAYAPSSGRKQAAGLWPDDRPVAKGGQAVQKDLVRSKIDPETGKPVADLAQVESLANLSNAEASSALAAINRLADIFADADLGFAKVVKSLDFDGKVAGALGGKNVAKRIYTKILSEILLEERGVALLRSPKLRNKFTDWVHRELADGLQLPAGVSLIEATPKIKAAFAKLVNDFTFGRTKGIKYLEVNPVLELADGTAVSMKQLFTRYMDKHGNKKTIKEARVTALDTFRQQMLSRVEEGLAAKWFFEQVGSKGWFDKGVSPRYLADIADYLGQEGHMPPVMKAGLSEIKNAFSEADAAGNTFKAKAIADVAERMRKRDPQLSLEQATNKAEQLVNTMHNRLSEFGSSERWARWQDNILPSLQDRGTPGLPVIDDSAGIVRWKAPTAVDDMAGWTQMMGGLGGKNVAAIVNKELGGSLNSTLSWMFMAARQMESGSWLSSARQLSSAIKRNLTTQRPQTALTNFVSNYLAMITREGLLPQQAAIEIGSMANVWRRYAKDPTSLPPLERARFKGMLDRGVASNNAVNVDANIVLDMFDDNPMSKVSKAATSLREAPGVGKVMKGFDWAYQAGDGIFKMTDAMRAIKRLDNYMDQLRPGNSMKFTDTSRGNKTLGRAFRERDGSLTVEYKGKRHKGKAAEKALEDLKMDTSVGYANGLYFDYSRVPGFIELARNFDAIGFGPFKTWAWKSLDIPFLKRGMGTRAIFGDTMITSTDPHVMARMYLRQSAEGMRRATIMGLTRSNTRDDEYLRMLLPEWLAPSAFFKDETMTFRSLGNRNFAINMSNILDAAWKMTRGTHQEIAIERLRRKEKVSYEELAKLVWDEGLVVGSLNDFANGEDSNGNEMSSPSDWYRYFSAKLLPGWVNASTETLGTLWDGMAGFSGLQRANEKRDPQTRIDTAAWLLKTWTGRRLEHFKEDEILGTLSLLSGRYQKKRGSSKSGKRRPKGTLLDKHFKKLEEKDIKEYIETNDPTPEGLRLYAQERKAYYGAQHKQISDSYWNMYKELKQSFERKREASAKFKRLASEAAKGNARAKEELSEFLGAQADLGIDAENMLSTAAQDVIPERELP